MVSSLELEFWGTRALVATPGANQQVFGGNTSCLQIKDAQDPNWFVVINAGFGINNLGETLFSPRPQNFHIFFSDFHWGHLQGLPFFLPIFFEQNHIHLYSPLPKELLHERLDILFDPSFSPFEGLRKMPANIDCHQITAPVQVGPLSIEAMSFGQRNPHAAKSLGCERFAYKICSESQVKTSLSVALSSTFESADPRQRRRFEDFVSASELLVQGATNFKNDAYPFSGAGCSQIGEAIQLAQACQVPRVLLSEHAPGRSDDDIQAAYLQAQLEYPDLDFEFAKENTIYSV